MLNLIKCIMYNANYLYRRYIIIIQPAGPDDRVVEESCSTHKDSNKVQIIFIGTIADL